MNHRVTLLPLIVLTAWVAAHVAGAAEPGATPSIEAGQPFAAPSNLTATLADPINIDLKWQDNANNESGYFVEYSPDANNEYFIIEALPPNTTSYRHPNLLPETRFVFRVRPFFGVTSNVAEVTTGKEAPQQDLQSGNTTAPNLAPIAKHSLKSGASLADAAPINLTAELIPPAGVRLRWIDRAADADGYMVEIKSPGADFRASAFLAAGTTTLVSYNFPFETKFEFRVRAFIYGQPSNLAEQTTGQDPTMVTGPVPPKAAAEKTK
jgi:hypothetical protein